MSAMRSWPRWGSCRQSCANSLAWDQGSELALHADIAQALGMPVFFCQPH